MVPPKGRKGVKKQSKPASPPRPAPVSRKSGKNPFPVVGVGASAGGLDAFITLFQALPEKTGMGYVVVQHMDPSKESMLTDILSRSLPLPVTLVTDGMQVRRDTIHVMPAGTSVGIVNGRLTLVPRIESRGLHLPIDFFFRSLAHDLGTQAIGIVLSGNGSDGTEGVRAIKAEGGVTLAQDEKSAKYNAMPVSAVASGCIDFVLPPKGIAEELVRFGSHPYIARNRNIERETGVLLEETEDDLARIFLLVRDVFEVDFSQYKPSTTRRRILRRMALQKIMDMKSYARRLQEDPREIEALYQDFLINVTSFFRDPEIFEQLKKTVFTPMLKDRMPADPIRIWVPACSTGEEAYSIAILALEAMQEQEINLPLQIFATDINEVTLETARVGSYPEGIAQDVSAERLGKFFSKTPSGYQIHKTIRESCIFARQNLAKDPPFSRLDLVSCRNVLIYMKQNLHKKILSTFHYAIRPGGFLLLGNSESVSDLSDLFGIVDRKARIYDRKTVLSRAAVDFGLPMRDHDPVMTRRRMASAAPSVDELQKEADKVALSQFSPPGVVVNENLDIIQFRGQTSPYISPAPGTASLNLAKLAKEGLVPDVRMAIRKARTEGRPARKGGIRLAGEEGGREINLHVLPVRLANLKEDHFMVLFESVPARPEGEVDRESLRKGTRITKEREQYISHIETELATTKEYLQTVGEEYEATTEELRSANEEIQSSNEELQSTNEELETAKEELQSTNEELITVNEALSSRNAELALVNNDLSNLLASVNIPLVMVGHDLKIRRYTPSAEKIFSLIPTDVGRPISDIAPNVPLPNLVTRIREVLNSLVVSEEEVSDGDGRTYVVRIRPYRTEDNRIEGAVVAVFDVTMVKSHQHRQDIAQITRETLNGLRDPILVLDGKLRVRSANQAFYRFFGTKPSNTEGRLFEEVGKGQLKNNDFDSLLKGVLSKKTAISDLRMDIEFQEMGRITTSVSAGLIPGVSPEDDMIIVAFGEKPARAEKGR